MLGAEPHRAQTLSVPRFGRDHEHLFAYRLFHNVAGGILICLPRTDWYRPGRRRVHNLWSGGFIIGP